MAKKNELTNYPPSIDLAGKTVLITGGYGHLGSGIVKSLLLHQANVVVLGRDESKYKKLLKGLKSQHLNSVHFQVCNLEETQSIKTAFKNTNDRFGSLDTIINNGVYSRGQSPENMSDEEWAFGIDGVLSSVFRCIRESIPYLMKSKGSIINVSSMYGLVSPDFQIYDDSPEFLNPPHYGAAKAGIIQLSKYYASFLGSKGIRVNTVSPGPFPSIAVQHDSKFIKRLEDKTLLNRIGRPEDLGGIFAFLCSDAATYITGQNFIVDGGWTAK